MEAGVIVGEWTGIVEPDFNGGLKGGTLGLKTGTDLPLGKTSYSD
jgi:hypothetical protein